MNAQRIGVLGNAGSNPSPHNVDYNAGVEVKYVGVKCVGVIVGYESVA